MSCWSHTILNHFHFHLLFSACMKKRHLIGFKRGSHFGDVSQTFKHEVSLFLNGTLLSSFTVTTVSKYTQTFSINNAKDSAMRVIDIKVHSPALCPALAISHTSPIPLTCAHSCLWFSICPLFHYCCTAPIVRSLNIWRQMVRLFLHTVFFFFLGVCCLVYSLLVILFLSWFFGLWTFALDFPVFCHLLRLKTLFFVLSAFRVLKTLKQEQSIFAAIKQNHVTKLQIGCSIQDIL